MKFSIFTMPMTVTTTSPFLRGHHHYSPRNLIPRPNDGHHSSYTGCLGLSNSELSQSWSFQGQPPSCSWVHTDNGNDSGASGSSSGGSSGSGSGSSGSGNSSSEGSGGGGSGSSSGGNGYEDDDGNNKYGGDDYSNTGGGYGVGDDDSGNNGSSGEGAGNYANNDEIVVSNEDIYNGDSDYDPFDDFDIEVVRIIKDFSFIGCV